MPNTLEAQRGYNAPQSVPQSYLEANTYNLSALHLKIAHAIMQATLDIEDNIETLRRLNNITIDKMELYKLLEYFQLYRGKPTNYTESSRLEIKALLRFTQHSDCSEAESDTLALFIIQALEMLRDTPKYLVYWTYINTNGHNYGVNSYVIVREKTSGESFRGWSVEAILVGNNLDPLDALYVPSWKLETFFAESFKHMNMSSMLESFFPEAVDLNDLF